jgi:hypothetical protein
MHVDRIGFHAHLGTVGGEGFDLVEQNDARVGRTMFRKDRAEQMRNSLLGLAMGGAGERVRIDLDVGEPGA